MGLQTRSRNATGWRTAWIGRAVNIVFLLASSTGGGRKGGLYCADARRNLSEHDESVVARTLPDLGRFLPEVTTHVDFKTPTAQSLERSRANSTPGSRANSPGVEATGHETLAKSGRVPKTVFSDKVRMLALVGLEGSGHHYVLSAISVMFNTSKIEFLRSSARDHALADSSMTAAEQKSLQDDMRAIADAERLMQDWSWFAREIQKVASNSFTGGVSLLTVVGILLATMAEAPGTIVSINLNSYPTGNNGDKVLSYCDLRLVAEMAEKEGVDLRIIYLQRPARDILLSNINHRSFPDAMRLRGGASSKEHVDYYVRSIFADVGVMDSLLREIDPAFIVCHQYNEMQSVEQATRIGDFVSPTTEVARFFTAALLRTAHISSEDEELEVAEADLVVERFQKKFDSFEPLYCGTGYGRF